MRIHELNEIRSKMTMLKWTLLYYSISMMLKVREMLQYNDLYHSPLFNVIIYTFLILS